MPTTVLPIGRPFTMVQNQVYAAPPRTVLVYVQNNLSSIEQSNDASTWTAVTLDDDESFLCASTYLRSTGVDTIVSLKA